MLKKLFWNDDAQAMTEYALIIALIAFVAIAGLLEVTGGVIASFYSAIIELF